MPGLTRDEPIHRRADRLLELARTAVPFVAGLVASRDAATGHYTVLSHFGYRTDLERYLLTDFLEHDPGFSAVVDQPERTLFWADVPNFADSTTARSVLVPGGFREGTSLALHRTGAPIGVAHLSMASVDVPAHARAFLAALRPDLTDLVSDARRCPRSVDGEGLTLTARELDVLRLVAAGLTNQQIARRLTISISTVSTHLERIHTKLHVTNRVAAATAALRGGLID